MNLLVNYLVKHCLENNLGNVLIRELTGIKQGINHIKRNNQNFVPIPFGTFKCMLESKCFFHCIKYQLVDEAYKNQVDSLT